MLNVYLLIAICIFYPLNFNVALNFYKCLDVSDINYPKWKGKWRLLCKNPNRSLAFIVNKPPCKLNLAGINQITPSQYEESSVNNDGRDSAAVDKKRRKKRKSIKLYPPDVKVHAPRAVTKNVRTRYKYKPTPKRLQGTKPKDTTIYPYTSTLRINGGMIRGRKLCYPPVYLRPMMNQVKGALFSTLRFLGLFYPDRECCVIDLFCGSGSVGLEALSYGAKNCTFVDSSIECCKATSLNVDHCGFQDKVRIIRADAMETITSPWLYSIDQKFDLLLACPPYEEIIYKNLVESVAKSSILNKNAVVVIEYPREISHLPHNVLDGKLLGIRNRRYGRTVVAIYLYEPSENRMELVEDGKREFVPTMYSRKRLLVEGYIKKPNELDPFVI